MKHLRWIAFRVLLATAGALADGSQDLRRIELRQSGRLERQRVGRGFRHTDQNNRRGSKPRPRPTRAAHYAFSNVKIGVYTIGAVPIRGTSAQTRDVFPRGLFNLNRGTMKFE